jgi:hypothetical protein
LSAKQNSGSLLISIMSEPHDLVVVLGGLRGCGGNARMEEDRVKEACRVLACLMPRESWPRNSHQVCGVHALQEPSEAQRHVTAKQEQDCKKLIVIRSVPSAQASQSSPRAWLYAPPLQG